MSADTRASDVGESSTHASGLSPRLWVFIIASAIVFVALAISIANILSADYYPARYIDVDATRLVPTGEDAFTLHLGLRFVANRNSIKWRVVPNHRELGGVVVEVRSAPGTRASDKEQNEDLFMLELPVPPAERLTVLDHRWGRIEGLVVEREAGR